MFKSQKFNKRNLVGTWVLAIGFMFPSGLGLFCASAQANSFSIVHKNQKTAHKLALSSLGVFQSAFVLNAEARVTELATQVAKKNGSSVPTSEKQLATPVSTVDLSVISFVKYGGVRVHF